MKSLISTAAVVVTALLLSSAPASVHALNNGLGLTPPMGWSSWCSYGSCFTDYCNEAEVLNVAKAMKANGLQAMGYHWLILDDCWAAGPNRTSEGKLTWDVSRFPNGIPNLTATLHNQGFKFGLYTSAGNQTCSSGGRPYPIPGSQHHYQLDMDTFASWDVDYVKVDWCGDVHQMPLDGIAVGAKLYKEVGRAINNTTPKKAMYLEGVAAQFFLLSETNEYTNSYRASTDHHDNWRNTHMVLDFAYALDPVLHDHVTPKPGAWAYMDVLMTGGAGCPDWKTSGNPNLHCPGMKDHMYQAEFTLWSLRQSPLIIGTNVLNMTRIMNDTLYNAGLIKIHQDTRTPPGRSLGAVTNGGCGGYLGSLACNVFARDLHDGSALVVVLNDGRYEMQVTMELTQVFKGRRGGSSSFGNATAVDMWSGVPLTVSGGNFTGMVVNQGIVAFQVWPDGRSASSQK